jgi:hypothetical protein
MNSGETNVKPTDTSRNQMTYICITIDTEFALLNILTSRMDVNAPAILQRDQIHVFAVANLHLENQNTGEVALDIDTGDVVRVFAKSASNQFEHAVVLTGIQHVQGDAILERFELVTKKRTCVEPASPTSPLLVQFVQRQFVFCECDVIGEGISTIELTFAIYDRDEQGQPRFVGYCQWSPRLTFHFRSPSDKTTS